MELTSVLVNPGDLREAVAAFRENILRPCFEIENPPRKFFVDIRGVLPSGGVPDNYTYEPHMLGGHICLTELVYFAYFSETMLTTVYQPGRKLQGHSKMAYIGL